MRWSLCGSFSITTFNFCLLDMRIEAFDKTYKLPFSCVGTGHVIFKQTLYCQRMFTNKIMKISLKESRLLAERPVEQTDKQDTFPYQSGKYSDIDFAVDEKGLWVVYATNASRGYILISKINEDDLTFEKTWATDILKKDVGNTFMICGVLYAIDSYDKTPTFVKYMFDTNTAKQRTLDAAVLPFKNSLTGDYARLYSLDYSPADKALYSWNNGRIEIYPVSFVDDNDP